MRGFETPTVKTPPLDYDPDRSSFTAPRQASLSDNGAGGPLLAGRALSLCKSPSSGSVTVHQPNHQSVNLFFPPHQRGRERHCCVQSESRCSGERASERERHSHTHGAAEH
ncbi:hypothetical protein QQF64_001846 [Cirrhinus molitorella]|uniref:Uncharacterized protein n=1 Tax=Cirrhinus molitorella TaxID=172907 RepID=A0ABR3MNG1_9TELE